VLRNATFRKLYTALVLSSFGDWLGFLATTALATQLADSFQGKAYATGGVLVFRLLPAVLFGPLAGAFADRWDRRTTMVVCDLLRFLLFLSIPLVGSVADRDTALVYLLLASFLIETVSLFWIPAKEASVPNLVPREQLEGANQLTLIATYGSAPVAGRRLRSAQPGVPGAGHRLRVLPHRSGRPGPLRQRRHLPVRRRDRLPAQGPAESRAGRARGAASGRPEAAVGARQPA
jgi:hypothetical protein